MPTNLLKKYPQLLDISGLPSRQRKISLQGIFERDVINNNSFIFLKKQIRPIKSEGDSNMQTLFHHLTTRANEDENGKKLAGRTFELDRSQRLHWVKYHIDQKKKENIRVFSCEERIKGKDTIRTYIHDLDEKYLIILEPQRSGKDYYLLTAYYLNEKRGINQIKSKYKKRLDKIL